MSLILEALKKSEAERRRGEVPGLHAPQSATPPAPTSRPHRNLALAAFLILLAAALFWLWIRIDAGSATAPALPTVPDAAPPAAATAATAPDAAADQAVASTPAPPPAAVPPPEPAAPAGAGAAMATETAAIPVPAPAPSPAPAVDAVATASFAGQDQDSLALAALPTDQRAQLPPLRLSMFVYSEDAARRFAILDGQRVGEGSAIAPGLSVLRIERERVLLDWQGQRLWLPRP
jgi:general secretion pathway protein B